MTLLCNQWSASHNGLSLGATEAMTHNNGTQCPHSTPAWSCREVRNSHQVQPDTSPTPHSASRNISPADYDFTHWIWSPHLPFISNIISSRKPIFWLHFPCLKSNNAIFWWSSRSQREMMQIDSVTLLARLGESLVSLLRVSHRVRDQ